MDTNETNVKCVRQKNTINCEGQDVHSVNIFLKGKAEVFISADDSEGKTEPEILDQSYKLFDLGNNTFIGVNDILMEGKYSFSCCASEDSNIYSFAVSNKDQLKNMINSNKDYGAFIAASISILIGNTYSALLKAEEFAKSLGIVSDNLAVYLMSYKINQACSYTPAGKIFTKAMDNYQGMADSSFAFPIEFNKSFFEQDHSEFFESDYKYSGEIDISKVNYHKHLLNVPPDICKGFFSSDGVITDYYIKDASDCLYELQKSIRSVLKQAGECMDALYKEGEDCIFSEYVKTAFAVIKAGGDTSVLLDVIGYIISRVKTALSIYENDYLHNIAVDVNRLENIFEQLIAFKELPKGNASGSVEASGGFDGEGINQELTNSAQKIVEYSEIPKKQADLFLENLRRYSRIKGHSTQDPAIRKLISDITSDFFQIYERVFKKAYEQKNTSTLLDMFLRYAYMDEKLLSPANIAELYKLSILSEKKSASTVYDMKGWLTAVYEMEKDPSINDCINSNSTGAINIFCLKLKVLNNTK
jgi:hypothetical protein